MSIILPYNDNISKYDGAFIKPNGDIIPVYGKHEKSAYHYCTGSSLIIGKSESAIPYLTPNSQLDEEEYQLYQLWKSSNSTNITLVTDFLTLILGYDKVEKIESNSITTSSFQPHIRFYNYYLMDWDITVMPRYQYDSSKGCFIQDKHFYTSDYKDLDAANEIERIKDKVITKNRKIFFQ